MTLATILTRAQEGVSAPEVSVEVHLANGLPSISMVGLPETAVKESRDRVRAALLNSRFQFPAQRITISLAPADLPKDGGRYDLSVALGILAASGQIPTEATAAYEFIGELALSGELRPVKGLLPVALATARAGRALIAPQANAQEAALIDGLRVYAASHLLEVCGHLAGMAPLAPVPAIHAPQPVRKEALDLDDVKGQARPKRALEIAAAGGHNLLMIGPPGTGKTMLASRLASLLPDMPIDEALETAAISSISEHGLDMSRWLLRPFRSPHHTASAVALVGGGSHPKPGEISLAHNGVLFLDELTQFSRKVLDVLREPLETGRICISRAARQVEFPARFQLVAAMNPCPQGYDCDFGPSCRCSAEQQRRHRSSISAPLLDRIDLHVEVARVPHTDMRGGAPSAGDSRAVRARVAQARERQRTRQGKINALLAANEVGRVCTLRTAELTLLEQAITRFRLSARAYHRILKVARTIADIEGEDAIASHHLGEAIGYRTLDRLL